MRARQPSPDPPSRTLFLVNPLSGGGRGIKILEKMQILLDRDYPEENKSCHIELTRHPDLTEQVQEACKIYKTIVAVGGDGTASQILNGIFLAGGNNSFGLIPLGTGNDLARSLGIYDPKTSWSQKALGKSLRKILRGSSRPMDLFEIQGMGIFCNYAGFGMDARVLFDYTRLQCSSWYGLIRWSRGLKFLIYGILLFRHLPYRLPRGIVMTLRRGEYSKTFSEDTPIVSVVVSNTQTYAGGFVLHKGSKIDDGCFEVTLIRGIPDIIRILLARFIFFRGLTSRLLQDQADALEWSVPDGLPFQRDGEPAPAPLPSAGSIRFAGRIEVIL
jgi:diacylglycerol kinase family enzyme